MSDYDDLNRAEDWLSHFMYGPEVTRQRGDADLWGVDEHSRFLIPIAMSLSVIAHRLTVIAEALTER